MTYQRNWVFVTNSAFLNPISLEPNVVDLRYFKLWILLIQIIRVWNIEGLQHWVLKILGFKYLILLQRLNSFETIRCMPKFKRIQSLPKFKRIHSLPKFKRIHSLPKFKRIHSLPKFERIRSLQKFKRIRCVPKFQIQVYFRIPELLELPL